MIGLSLKIYVNLAMVCVVFNVSCGCQRLLRETLCLVALSSGIHCIILVTCWSEERCEAGV